MLRSVESLLPVAAHTAGIYFFLIVAMRLIGRRQLGQFTVLDLVIILVMGSAVETAMIAGDTRLPAGLVSAGTLLLLNRLLTILLARSRRLRHLVLGSPVLLVHHGHFVEEHLRRVGLTEEDVLEAIRERGEAGVKDVKYAVLELDGAINVVPMEAQTLKGKRDIRDATGEATG